jgi:hypothetical protein
MEGHVSNGSVDIRAKYLLTEGRGDGNGESYIMRN